MKKVLALIEKKKQEFSKLPFFEFLQDKSIRPQQRLAFTPCAAPFVMGFGELNKYVFREEPTSDPIQKIINKHTYEDDHHWLWFLKDLEQLGFDRALNFSDALRYLWSEDTKIPRQAIYKLYRYSFQAEPIQKLVIIEAIEATGNVFSTVVAPISQEIKSITNQECQFFGDVHLSVETGHTTGADNVSKFMENIQMTEETQKEAFELVKKVFEIFTELTNALLAYAKTHYDREPFVKTHEIEQSRQAA